MNRQELEQYLPHRGAMLLVDEADVTEDGYSTGSYTVRGDEWFLQGHFPGNPIVPGVVLCEMLAQSSCTLFLARDNQVTPLYTGMDKVRFRKKVVPGDTVTFKCSLQKQAAPFYFIRGEGFVNGELCVSGEFSFAILPNAQA
jgi:3-hydroxyacyl-[acyl-carrier-protein] dehydratase